MVAWRTSWLIFLLCIPYWSCTGHDISVEVVANTTDAHVCGIKVPPARRVSYQAVSLLARRVGFLMCKISRIIFFVTTLLHRACAAFLALSLRFFLLSFFARANPPKRPASLIPMRKL